MTVQEQLVQLDRLIRQRDWFRAQNDAHAAKDPAFARRLAAVRNQDDLDARAEAALQNVGAQLAGAGMGYVAAIVGSVFAVAVVTAVSLVYMQMQNEQLQYCERNPGMCLAREASTGIWAILGVGALILGGIVYWDYRSAKKQGERLYGRDGGGLDYGVRRGGYPGFSDRGEEKPGLATRAKGKFSRWRKEFREDVKERQSEKEEREEAELRALERQMRRERIEQQAVRRPTPSPRSLRERLELAETEPE